MLNARPVQGPYRRLRWWVDWVLIAILFAVPWIEIGGEPLLRVDLPARQFHVFGLVLYPQELVLLWLVVAGLALALFFFTAVAGRLWCGWACPQTVFTDAFAAIARRVQGYSRTGPPRHVSVWRRVLTHVLWIAFSLVIGFHLVSYYHSPYELARGILRAEASPVALGFLGVLAAASYFDFGMVRQTFCKTVCPYARLQGVLFDDDTLVIGYDRLRGEPRGKRGTTEGDCIDCRLCVDVCPSEIDIRDGLQLECIACTHCIDACDSVMAKIGRAPNLIGYRSQVGLERIRPVRILRPRVIVYAAGMLAIGAAFTWVVQTRIPVDLQIARNRTELYVTMPDGRIGNAYTIHVENRDRVAHDLRITLRAEPGFELVAGVNPLALGATDATEASVFVVAPMHAIPAGTSPLPIAFDLEPLDRPQWRISRRTTFVHPKSGTTPRGDASSEGDLPEGASRAGVPRGH